MSVLKPEEYRVALMKTNFLLEQPSTPATSKSRRRLRKLKTLLRVAPGEVARITLADLDKLIATFPPETQEELTHFITTHQEQVALSNVAIGMKLLDLKGREDLGYMTTEFVKLIYEQLLSFDFYQPSEQIVEVINALHSGTEVDPGLIRHFVLSYYRRAIDILSPTIGQAESARLHEHVTLAENGVFKDFNFFVDNLELDQTTERNLLELRIVGGKRKTVRKRKRKVTRKRR